MTRLWPFAAMIGFLAIAAPAYAAGQGLGFIDPKSNSPIALDAEDGIEWHRKENVYIAKKARAQSGDMIIEAEELRGYYRGGPTAETMAKPDSNDNAGDNMELYKLEAVGNVRIQSGEHRAVAEKAFYDIDQSVFVMMGRNLELRSPQAKLSAGERIEYWQNKNLAVARGGAAVAQGKSRLSADTITAHFFPAKTGGDLNIRRVDAAGSVKVNSDGNLAQSDKATYDMAEGLATLQGNVKLTQGPNQLNGDYAEMNTKTGVSRMLSNKDNSSGMKRVRALVIPDPAKRPGNF